MRKVQWVEGSESESGLGPGRSVVLERSEAYDAQNSIKCV
jgi:hypothetical protein